MAKAKNEAPKDGEKFDVPWPFIREVFDWGLPGGPDAELTWKPGYLSEQVDEWDAHNYAHGSGLAKFGVVTVARLPAPYPARVFYTRQWQDPDGKVFGKKRLLQTTIPAFRRLVGQSGFDRLHVFSDVEDLSEDAKARMLRRS